MADKDRVADGEYVAVGIEKADDIESWTSRQIEYLHRRRAAFKGVITKNTKKARISSPGIVVEQLFDA